MRNDKTQRILKSCDNGTGYLIVSLRKDNKTMTKKVHRLVMESFRSSSELTVNHIDHNKYNNSLNNLEYVTQE